MDWVVCMVITFVGMIVQARLSGEGAEGGLASFFGLGANTGQPKRTKEAGKLHDTDRCLGHELPIGPKDPKLYSWLPCALFPLMRMTWF
eukprot:3789208-Amphidinium_carterae.1